MTSPMTPTVSPQRGLYAAVRPDGVMLPETIRSSEFEAQEAAVVSVSPLFRWGGFWGAKRLGWRIIRVDVVPVEDVQHYQQENSK